MHVTFHSNTNHNWTVEISQLFLWTWNDERFSFLTTWSSYQVKLSRKRSFHHFIIGLTIISWPVSTTQHLNWCCSRFKTSSPCSHGDTSKNTPGSTVCMYLTFPENARKHTMFILRRFSYTHLCAHRTHLQAEKASWLPIAQTRAAVNKWKWCWVSKVNHYTKSKTKFLVILLWWSSVSCLYFPYISITT